MPLWSQSDLLDGSEVQPGDFLEGSKIARENTPQDLGKSSADWAVRILDVMLLSSIAAYGYSARDVYEETFVPNSLEGPVDIALFNFSFDDLKNLHGILSLNWNLVREIYFLIRFLLGCHTYYDLRGESRLV